MTQDEIRAERARLVSEREVAVEKAREIEDAMRVLMYTCNHPRLEELFCPDCGADWSPDH